MVEQSHLAKFAEFVISDDNSELGIASAERDYALHCLEREIAIAQSEQARCQVLVKALEDIKAATLNGSVCNDVAWFGPGETLHDFCERMLDHVGSPRGQT